MQVDQLLPAAANPMKVDQLLPVAVAAAHGSADAKTINYMAERVVGTGSFGIVVQAKCLETDETLEVKKVLQDKRYKNRKLQIT